MISFSNTLSPGSGTPIQVRAVLVHAMSGTELSRVRTEFRLRHANVYPVTALNACLI
jgi:hypothetical protein